jgi:hypothetical protein
MWWKIPGNRYAAAPGQADIRFANAVNAFEEAAMIMPQVFREAVILSPDDEILPFTYTQALFATGIMPWRLMSCVK